jgi:UPF0271 protein
MTSNSARIDINCDIGEIPEMIADGRQEAILTHLTSVNIACGGHAGDDWTMRTSVDQARRYGLKIGAHPGYPDRANFGRLEIDMPLGAVEQTVHEQILALAKISGRIDHVKPHGALYNQAARDERLALAIARGVARYDKTVTLVGLAGSRMLTVFRAEGFPVLAECFADRRYESDGTLRNRKLPGALIEDPAEAAAQALRLAELGLAGTVCIHGDTPNAARIAAAVAAAFNR